MYYYTRIQFSFEHFLQFQLHIFFPETVRIQYNIVVRCKYCLLIKVRKRWICEGIVLSIFITKHLVREKKEGTRVFIKLGERVYVLQSRLPTKSVRAKKKKT